MTAPRLVSLVALTRLLTNATALQYLLTLSENVAGLSASHFAAVCAAPPPFAGGSSARASHVSPLALFGVQQWADGGLSAGAASAVAAAAQGSGRYVVTIPVAGGGTGSVAVRFTADAAIA